MVRLQRDIKVTENIISLKDLSAKLSQTNARFDTIQEDNRKWLADKDEYISYLRSTYSKEIDTLKEVMAKRDDEINQLRFLVEKHKTTLGKFRSSIIYPLYQFSSGVGKSRLGMFLQKLLK
ncbi:MAG: hypothetical protein ABIJ34_03755 [archaeon]